ncbi:MAG: type II toxin-antitoxin system antitoxin SocA domain-containing protein [Brevinema sp.]
MYIADRRLLEQNEAPFTNDTYVAMKNGMVLSNVYSLIKHNTLIFSNFPNNI